MRIEYKLQEWNGGKVWVEEAYPNILFAKDGEIYDIAGMKTIVIGGAYSVDKFYRLSKGYNWFEDEQPSDEIKAYVEKQLSNNDWNVDVVLSHTVPYYYRPVDLFLSMIDQSSILIKMAQLNRRKTVLDVMRKRLPKSREEQRSYMSRNSVPEYRYINYDLELVKNEYELVSKSIMEMQMALDKYNQTVQFEVDI